MAKLILGPSGAGKTFYIEGLIKNGEAKIDDVVYGYQIKKSFKFFGIEFGNNKLNKKSIVHYNILNYLVNSSKDKKIYNIKNEKFFVRILKQKKLFDEVIILVSSKDELILRAKNRIKIEKNINENYNNKFWTDIYENINLFKIYENLFDILEYEKIKYKVIFSTNNSSEPFLLTDRVYVHQNLRGIYNSLPSRTEVKEIAVKKEMHYQSVLLPYNTKSSTKEFKHIPLNRDESFTSLTGEDLRDKSVLDIGSAIGNYLFIAERYGASKLYGVEKNKDRYLASTMVADLLNSKSKFVNSDFDKNLFNEKFDFVLCLNIIHHVLNFEKFLYDAAHLTKNILLLEFPTFSDPKFLSIKKIRKRDANKMNKISLIGVSSLKKIDQTFVYSPVAIKELLLNSSLGFKSYEVYDSPITGRVVMLFKK